MDKNMMYNGQSVMEIIKKRVSVRTYKDRALTDDVKERLTDYLKTLGGPFDINVRFLLMNSHMKDKEVRLGTYGVIKNAPSFIAAVVEKGDLYLEQLGYQFEKAVLYATHLGLGTCWLGGTFNKGGFAKAANLKENEELPIVSPVGFPAENKSVIETLMRMGAGSNSRKGWKELFFDKSFDKALSSDKAGKYSNVLDMVRLAPSASNKQPWRIVMEDGHFHFYLKHTKGYAKVLEFSIQHVDIGIAMCHFDECASELGLRGSWVLRPKESGLPHGMEYIISWKVDK